MGKPYYPVRSAVVGVITALYVEDGAAVQEGDKLVEVEMMKVFHRVEACADGTIEWVAALGQTVGQGALLAKLYPLEK